jgi:protochlorophyllide reductase
MLGDLRGLEAGFKAPHCTISGRPFNGDKVYRDSKLCNVMTTLEMARRLQTQGSKVTCNALAPGFIPTTGLFRSYPSFVMSLFTFVMRDVLGIAVTEEEGGRRLAYMIDSPDLEGVSGAYYATNKKTRTFEAMLPSEEARDVNKAARLWHLTEKLLEEHERDEQ